MIVTVAPQRQKTPPALMLVRVERRNDQQGESVADSLKTDSRNGYSPEARSVVISS